MKVPLDGKLIRAHAGSDVNNGTVMIQADQLCSLVQGSDYGVHMPDLNIPLNRACRHTRSPSGDDSREQEKWYHG